MVYLLLHRRFVFFPDIQECNEGAGATEETLDSLIINECLREDTPVFINLPMGRNGVLSPEQTILFPP